jgi:hypothetical protein
LKVSAEKKEGIGNRCPPHPLITGIIIVKWIAMIVYVVTAIVVRLQAQRNIRVSPHVGQADVPDKYKAMALDEFNNFPAAKWVRAFSCSNSVPLGDTHPNPLAICVRAGFMLYRCGRR